MLGKNIYRKIKISLAAAAAVMMTAALPLTAFAAERTYKVEFRPGTHGTVAEAYAVQNVPYGEELTLPATDDIEPDEGYYFTGWNKDVETTVTGRAVYVAQYARMINRVSYTVSYVDSAGAELATKKVNYTEQGTVVTARAEEIEGYAPDAETKSITAAEDGAEITFVYTTTLDPEVIVEENVQTVTVPGTTTVVTEGTQGAAAGAAGTGTAGGAAGTTAGGTAAGAGAGAGTADAGTGTEAEGGAQPGGETADVTEDEVPLADNPSEDTEDVQDVGEDEVPLANKTESGNIAGIIAVAAVAVAAVAALTVYMVRKRR